MATNHDKYTKWEYSQTPCGVHPRGSQIQKKEPDVVAVSDNWCEIWHKIANTTMR